jgi:hypothetical protein
MSDKPPAPAPPADLQVDDDAPPAPYRPNPKIAVVVAGAAVRFSIVVFPDPSSRSRSA